MNVLERTILHRWRTEAYNCFMEADGDGEKAMQLFEAKKPPHMRAVPWELILTLVFELIQRWLVKKNAGGEMPSAVMDSEEAAFLGLESD